MPQMWYYNVAVYLYRSFAFANNCHSAFKSYVCICSDNDMSLDPQVPFIPSVEVLVKALLIMSPVAVKLAPDSFVRIIFCSHHPCVVGSAKRDAVWKVVIYILV